MLQLLCKKNHRTELLKWPPVYNHHYNCKVPYSYLCLKYLNDRDCQEGEIVGIFLKYFDPIMVKMKER